MRRVCHKSRARVHRAARARACARERLGLNSRRSAYTRMRSAAAGRRRSRRQPKRPGAVEMADSPDRGLSLLNLLHVPLISLS